MPIVAHTQSPSLIRVAKEGFDVISEHDAAHQDIRELHIGFLNMMPDAAFLATERQFFRLTAAATNIVQIYIHPIKCEGMQRGKKISQHIEKYYRHFDEIKAEGLDALIVTGANPQFTDLTHEPYWEQATTVFQWAEKNVCSVFFSCLATHAALQAQYHLRRTPLKKKLWGIYSHRVIDRQHPLVANINTKFDIPHSRNNDISAKDFAKKQLKVLVAGKKVGVAIATSNDGIRQVFCQGHPEYDISSLLKEYCREIQRFEQGEREDYPSRPVGFNAEVKPLLKQFKTQFLNKAVTVADFPEQDVLEHLDNTWRDTAKAIFSNWIGLVYRLTNVDRKRPFMEGIDPENPLAYWYEKH